MSDAKWSRLENAAKIFPSTTSREDTKVFRFDVDLERDFGFVDENGKRFLEAGEYYIMVKDRKVKIELVD